MNYPNKPVFLVLCLLVLFFQNCAGQETKSHGEFTGDILLVLYVKDVRRSVEFYRDKLGFDFNHYWDYEKNTSIAEWTSDEPPVYAQMGAGPLKFGLHLTDNPDELRPGGTLLYFQVKDVDAHHQMVSKSGIETGALIERPWMRMFSVVDLDGHKIFFFTPPD